MLNDPSSFCSPPSQAVEMFCPFTYESDCAPAPTRVIASVSPRTAAAPQKLRRVIDLTPSETPSNETAKARRARRHNGPAEKFTREARLAPQGILRASF